VQYSVPDKVMQEWRHIVCKRQAKRNIFRCGLYHIDTGKSFFKNFPPRWDVKYDAHL